MQSGFIRALQFYSKKFVVTYTIYDTKNNFAVLKTAVFVRNVFT